jgi:hypothetical protein
LEQDAPLPWLKKLLDILQKLWHSMRTRIIRKTWEAR